MKYMGTISFTPHAGYILVKVLGVETSEIDIVKDTDKTPADRGIVLAIGGPKRHEAGGFYESGVKVGDRVVFKPYGITEYTYNNEICRIIDFDNVRGIENEE